MNLQTYGKQNWLKREYYNIRYSLQPHKKTIELCESKGIGVYVPKMRTHKKVGLIVGVLLCISSPGTNWAIPFIARWSLK